MIVPDLYRQWYIMAQNMNRTTKYATTPFQEDLSRICPDKFNFKISSGYQGIFYFKIDILHMKIYN